MPMFDTQTIGDADIVILSAETGKVERSVHVNQKIRKLLAIGERFAVLLLPYLDSKYKNLAVVDLVEGHIVGGATVPHSRASTPDFSQVTFKHWNIKSNMPFPNPDLSGGHRLAKWSHILYHRR